MGSYASRGLIASRRQFMLVAALTVDAARADLRRARRRGASRAPDAKFIYADIAVISAFVLKR